MLANMDDKHAANKVIVHSPSKFHEMNGDSLEHKSYKHNHPPLHKGIGGFVTHPITTTSSRGKIFKK